jgi:CheY-like chemotaxis protein
MASVERSFNVLVVEDYKDVADMMNAMIERLGHRVSIAGTIAAAVENASKEKFDLFLVDHKLPDGKGSDILKRIPSTGRPQAVLLTAFDAASLSPAMKEGFSMVLRKPVDMNVLRETIESLCAG